MNYYLYTEQRLCGLWSLDQMDRHTLGKDQKSKNYPSLGPLWFTPSSHPTAQGT